MYQSSVTCLATDVIHADYQSHQSDNGCQDAGMAFHAEQLGATINQVCDMDVPKRSFALSRDMLCTGCAFHNSSALYHGHGACTLQGHDLVMYADSIEERQHVVLVSVQLQSLQAHGNIALVLQVVTRLFEHFPNLQMYNLCGGVIAWFNAGLPLQDSVGNSIDALHPLNEHLAQFITTERENLCV
jgi:hypothetical protein